MATTKHAIARREADGEAVAARLTEVERTAFHGFVTPVDGWARANEVLAEGMVNLIEAGIWLLACKKCTPHGRWADEVAKNWNYGERYARIAMQLAKHYLELDAKARLTFAAQPMREARREVQAPRPPKAEPKSQALDVEFSVATPGPANQIGTAVPIYSTDTGVATAAPASPAAPAPVPAVPAPRTIEDVLIELSEAPRSAALLAEALIVTPAERRLGLVPGRVSHEQFVLHLAQAAYTAIDDVLREKRVRDSAIVEVLRQARDHGSEMLTALERAVGLRCGSAA